MRRRWSRAVALLCIVYLVALLVFHRHLDPFGDTDARGDVDTPKEILSSVGSRRFQGNNSAHVRTQTPRNLQHQLHQLEAGMTQLEKEISNVKSKLTQELEERARINLRQQKDLQETPKPHREPPPSHQHREFADDYQNYEWQRIQNKLFLADQHQYEVEQQAQTVRRLRQQQERVYRQPFNRLPAAFPLKPNGIFPPKDHVMETHETGGALLLEEDYTNSSLMKIAEGVTVYAAYHDDRLPSKPTVRLIVILSAPKSSRRVLCHFYTTDLRSTVEAQQYELCENHKKKYLGFIFSCPVPAAMPRARYKLSLSSVHNPDSQIPIPVWDVSPPEIRDGEISEDKHQYKYNHSVCVSPLFGSVLAKRLVEFLELTRMLGVQQVFFYDFQLSSVIQRVLSFYKDKGWVSVLPWKLPASMTNTRIWYHGQLVSNNDCLYRTMPVSAFTAFHDIDEFIVPHHPHIRTLSELLPPVLPNDTCGYSFQSAFYDPGITANDFPDDLMTVSLTARPAMLSKIRTKVMVAPRRVFEVGIHHISKQFREHWAPRRFDSTRAILHHYRECIRDYGMRCENWVKDTIIKDRYMPQLKDKVQEVIRTLRL